MANEANIKAVITADDRASSVLRGFGDNVNSVAGKVGSVLKTAAEGLAVAGAAATAFGVASVKAFSESQDLIAQTNAVLASTGKVAGVTADQVTQLATAWQKQSKYSDEAVRGAENILLTFTNITKDIFPQTTAAVLDISTALHEDLQSAAIQVGKALQDPILGVTALRRVGVNFTDAQKDLIQSLVDTGKSAEAQQIILKELNKEFGGSAKAAGETFSGSLQKLKNSFNDVQEVIGQTIVKRLEPFISKAADAIASIDWQQVIDTTINAIKRFKDILGEVWQAMDKVYQQIANYLGPKIQALSDSISNIFPVLRKFVDEYINPVLKAFGTVAGEGLVWAIGAVIDILKDLIKFATPVFEFLDNHKGIVYALAGAFGALATSMALQAALDAITVGFATLQLVTIPSLVTSLGVLSAAFVAAIPVVAVGIALGAVILKYQETMDVIDETDAHIAASMKSVDDANNKLYDLTNAGKQSLDQLYKLQQGLGNTPSSQAISKYGPGGGLSGNTYLAGYAGGTDYAPGGPAIVGENGPELVNLPRGSQVISNNKSFGGGPNITIQAGAFMGSDVEARKFAQLIMKHYYDAMGSKMGMA